MRRLFACALLSCMTMIAGMAWAQDQATGTGEQAQTSAEQPQRLQQQIDELKARLADYDELKARLAELEKAAGRTSTTSQPVQPAFPNSKIKVDGRLFAAAFKTGDEGSYPNRSLDIPDAKLRFTFSPSKDVTIVNRYSNNRAGTNGFDYFYLDLNNWGGVLPGHVLRIGKFKIDVRQETWTDNPVEDILITNSVSHVSGYDEGLNFRGPLGKDSSATYSLMVMNGNKGVTPSDSGLAWGGKIGALVGDQLYISASYLRTGDLVKSDGSLDQPDFNVANLSSGPSGATGWKRSLWEVDARYGYGKAGISSVLGSAPSVPWQLGATYGQFTDDAAGVSDRRGRYWFVEGLYNITPKTYVASRYSTVSLDGDMLAKIDNSPVAVNSYDRFSLGLGYRLTDMTHLKAEYTRDSTSGAEPDPDLSQFAVGVATKF